MTRSTVAIVLSLVALGSSAFGYWMYDWAWNPTYDDSVYDLNDVEYLWLTPNNGSHSVALNGSWTSVAATSERWLTDPPHWHHDAVCAFEWSDYSHQGSPWPYAVWSDGGLYNQPGDASVEVNDYWKLWLSSEHDLTGALKDRAMAATDGLTGQDVDFHSNLTGTSHLCVGHEVAGLCVPGGSPAQRMVAAYTDNFEEDHVAYWGLLDKTSDIHGQIWSDSVRVLPNTYIEEDQPRSPSLAANSATAGEVYIAYQVGEDDVSPEIYFKKSTNYGASGSWGTAKYLGSGKSPCIAAVGQFVFVCWEGASDKKVYYRYSNDAGSNNSWVSEARLAAPNVGEFSQANLSATTVGGHPVILVVCQRRFPIGDPPYWYELFCSYEFVNGQLIPKTLYGLSRHFESEPDLRPSVASSGSLARTVYNTPIGNNHKRGFHLRRGEWKAVWEYFTPPYRRNWPPGRLIALGDDGSVQYAAVSRSNVVAGPVDGELVPFLVGPGKQPALALDGDANRWVSYTSDDTLWVATGDGSYKVAFAGSSSAVPGQPSIVCHPIQGGVTAGNVVFAVYDTAGGTSKIMYARVNIDGTILDTIESVNTIRDSLPSINVYLSDSFVVTWQHGDSVLSSLLSNYGPLTQGQPPAWSSPNLVTASGYHPMSVIENGSVVNCCWTRQSGGYSIQRATNDLGGGMFGNWVAMTAPSAASNVDKGNPVYAGVGASVWQQMVSGKWVIKGFVRGAETTLVANDTDAYHPYAVAESSAISPSIDQVRVHLLYTAGVAFEVDSGVYDTGETRFKTCSLNVSNAGFGAMEANNGTKLMRKQDSDSLFSVYRDADGSVMYAYSAAGDSWRREVLATQRCYPAIAADSTGKRWVVAMSAYGTVPAAQYLYYRSGGSWASQSLYSGWDILGPASLAGASSTTTGIAYTAFKVMGMFSQYIVLTKFNGTTVAACTLATGANFGDPSIAVEAYKTDSDHVHVTWEDAGVVKYRMNTDGRSSGIANRWTSVVTLSDAQATSHHPSINCDRDQIVAAWAQGATAEIYYRKRSTASAYSAWDAAFNLSNTANNASDWPTIAMGDTVVVAWEETRSGGTDHDVLACINFGDTLNVADNATVSGYPHVLFQNKASGDTAIPYLHTVWSETPSANFYEVAYNKLNLKQSSGEGQQNAKQVTLPVKPLLASCMPNPFRNHTQINYALPTAGNVSLRVYDVTGRTVRTLASGHQTAGNYSVNWDARDSRGKQVPYGVYFYRLDTPGFRSVKKAVVAR
jgi:hypothetical protein